MTLNPTVCLLTLLMTSVSTAHFASAEPAPNYAENRLLAQAQEAQPPNDKKGPKTQERSRQPSTTAPTERKPRTETPPRMPAAKTANPPEHAPSAEPPTRQPPLLHNNSSSPETSHRMEQHDNSGDQESTPSAPKKNPNIIHVPRSPSAPAEEKAAPLAPFEKIPPPPSKNSVTPSEKPIQKPISPPAASGTQAVPSTQKPPPVSQPTKPSEAPTLPKAPETPTQGSNDKPSFTPGFQPPGPHAQNLQDLQKNRTERVEEGGKRIIVQEPDNRVIIKQGKQMFIRHDETMRFTANARDVHSERRKDGTTETVIARRNGMRVYNVMDADGRLMRRYRRDEEGHEVDIIDNRRFFEGLAIGIGLGLAADIADLPPPEVSIPREEYIVEYEEASDEDIYGTLSAPPVDHLDRSYSLEEIVYSPHLRDHMRRVDLDTINFEAGTWEVSSDQYPKLERVAAAMKRIIDLNPREVFMVEGYTDATGSDTDNLSLSDRRAQSVAQVLSDSFDVPPENLVTQGYGEQYLKVQTQGPERANRRVTIRRITPLLTRNEER